MSMAEFVTILNIALLMVGAVGIPLSLNSVRRQLIAEREMVRSVTALLYGHELRGKEREEVKAKIERFEADTEPMARLLEEAARRLSKSDRDLVLGALRQDSIRGRKAYMRKLIHQAQLANAS